MLNNKSHPSLIRRIWVATRIPAAISSTADKLGRNGFPLLSLMVRHLLLLILVGVGVMALVYRFVVASSAAERLVCTLAAILLLMRAGISVMERRK